MAEEQKSIIFLGATKLASNSVNKTRTSKPKRTTEPDHTTKPKRIFKRKVSLISAQDRLLVEHHGTEKLALTAFTTKRWGGVSRMKLVEDASSAMAKKLWVRPLLTKAVVDPNDDYIRYPTSSLGNTERSAVLGAESHHDGGSNGRAEFLNTGSKPHGNYNDNNLVGPGAKPLPRLQQDPRNRQMNMVHTNLVRPVTFPPDETYSPQRLHCSTSFEVAAIPYDSELYSYGGAVKRVWFAAGADEWDVEDVMLCQASSCKKCSPDVEPNQFTNRSLTMGLPFVHRGRECFSRDVPTVILTRRDDGFSFHREVRRIPTIEFKPALEPAEDDNANDKLVNGFGSVNKDIPKTPKKEMVKFGQWNAQEAAVCVPSECPKCATPKVEMDYGGESEEEA